MPPVSPLTTCAFGCTVSAVVAVTPTGSPTCVPLTNAFTVHVPGVAGAVNVAVATPPVVCAKGVTVPQSAVKFTVVASGAGAPVFNSTTAFILDVPSLSAIIEGVAVMKDLLVSIATGLRNSVVMFAAPLAAEAVMVTCVSNGEMVEALIFAVIMACPFPSVDIVFP